MCLTRSRDENMRALTIIDNYMNANMVKDYTFHLMLCLLAKAEGKPSLAGNMYYRFLIYRAKIMEKGTDIRALLQKFPIIEEAKEAVMSMIVPPPAPSFPSHKPLSATELFGGTDDEFKKIDESPAYTAKSRTRRSAVAEIASYNSIKTEKEVVQVEDECDSNTEEEVKEVEAKKRQRRQRAKKASPKEQSPQKKTRVAQERVRSPIPHADLPQPIGDRSRVTTILTLSALNTPSHLSHPYTQSRSMYLCFPVAACSSSSIQPPSRVFQAEAHGLFAPDAEQRHGLSSFRHSGQRGLTLAHVDFTQLW